MLVYAVAGGPGRLPELVAPAVTYLASPQCVESGIIIEAGGGAFNRCSFVKSPGVTFDPAESPDADWFEARWDKITDLASAIPMWDIARTREEFAAEKAAGGGEAKRGSL